MLNSKQKELLNEAFARLTTFHKSTSNENAIKILQNILDLFDNKYIFQPNNLDIFAACRAFNLDSVMEVIDHFTPSKRMPKPVLSLVNGIEMDEFSSQPLPTKNPGLFSQLNAANDEVTQPIEKSDILNYLREIIRGQIKILQPVVSVEKPKEQRAQTDRQGSGSANIAKTSTFSAISIQLNNSVVVESNEADTNNYLFPLVAIVVPSQDLKVEKLFIGRRWEEFLTCKISLLGDADGRNNFGIYINNPPSRMSVGGDLVTYKQNGITNQIWDIQSKLFNSIRIYCKETHIFLIYGSAESAPIWVRTALNTLSEEAKAQMYEVDYTDSIIKLNPINEETILTGASAKIANVNQYRMAARELLKCLNNMFAKSKPASEAAVVKKNAQLTIADSSSITENRYLLNRGSNAIEQSEAEGSSSLLLPSAAIAVTSQPLQMYREKQKSSLCSVLLLGDTLIGEATFAYRIQKTYIRNNFEKLNAFEVYSQDGVGYGFLDLEIMEQQLRSEKPYSEKEMQNCKRILYDEKQLFLFFAKDGKIQSLVQDVLGRLDERAVKGVKIYKIQYDKTLIPQLIEIDVTHLNQEHTSTKKPNQYRDVVRQVLKELTDVIRLRPQQTSRESCRIM